MLEPQKLPVDDHVAGSNRLLAEMEALLTRARALLLGRTPIISAKTSDNDDDDKS